MEDCLLDLDRDIAEWIEALQQADQMFHHMMSMEFWSIARTMDELEPGFWSQYMHNRQAIFQQSMKERQQRQQKTTQEMPAVPPVSRRESPFKAVVNDEAASESLSERVSVFSETLDQELSQIRQLTQTFEVLIGPI